MFEGKEVSGKLGEYGDYGIDIKEQGSIDAEVMGKADKIFFGGIVTVKASLAAVITIDGKAAIIQMLGKSENFLAKMIVSAVSNLPKDAPAPTPGV